MKRPQEVHLSREDGEALRKRLASDTLTADDRQVLGHVLAWYFWLMFALQEAQFSLKRLRAPSASSNRWSRGWSRGPRPW